MQEVSVLPGRIRWKNHLLYYNKSLAKYINIYIDNLYGVKYSLVNHITASILVVYDPMKTNYHVIRKNIEHAISSALQNKPERIREYDEYDQALEKRDKAKKNSIIYGMIYLAFKVKDSLYGKTFLSSNVRVLQAASLVTIIGGYPLLKSFYKKFTRNIPADSDILLSLTALSFTLTRESSKGVLLLMLKAMNDYLKYSADAECLRLLNQSMNKTSEMAWLVSSSREEVLVGVDTLRIDDVISAHEGEVIPVQGEVIGGSALINTLYYTGQPVVSRIGEGSNVYEGLSILSGNLTIKVKKLPVKEEKPKLNQENMYIHQRVSKFQKKITLLSLGAGAVSYLISGNIMNTLAVLLVLSPSGSGTALSTGMKSYLTLLNKNKIFLRRPEVFERIVNIEHILFDKTGTLTEGIMKLEFIKSFNNNFSDQEILKICAACESDHYHPISLTIQNENKRNININEVKDSILIPSKGIIANYKQHQVLIGKKEFMEENGIDLNHGLDMYQDCEKKRLTPVFIVIDHELTGMLVLADVLREGSSELIKRIKQKPSLKVTMLTGDNHYKAQDIAHKLGINRVYSNCSFEDKAKIIGEYKKTETVTMVGDGINDVEAMKAADVSISLADFSCDQVKLNSDVIIFEENMLGIPDMISLSEKAYCKINQSITISQMYNILFGGLAFVGAIDAFTAKSFNTINSLMVLLLNKRIEYL